MCQEEKHGWEDKIGRGGITIIRRGVERRRRRLRWRKLDVRLEKERRRGRKRRGGSQTADRQIPHAATLTNISP